MFKEDFLRKFYDGLSKASSLSDLGVPPSIVFFVRRAIEDRTGVCYPIEHVWCSLFLEGYLDPDKHFVNGLPRWYSAKYFKGKHPDMSVLRDKLRILYQRHLKAISDSAELMVDEADTGELQKLP